MKMHYSKKSKRINFFAFIIFFFITFNLKAGWDDMDTGIDDDLTGVVFFGDNGAVSGHSGIYYTTTGGVGPSSWTRFDITMSSSDALLYSHSRFNHCFAENLHSDYVFACGQDTVDNKAVIFQLHIPTQSYMILFEGAIGTSLNNIDYSDKSDQYFAVGEDGLIVRFNLNVSGIIEPTDITRDFSTISFVYDKIIITSNDYRVNGIDNDPGLSLELLSNSGIVLKDAFRTFGSSSWAVGDALHLASVIPNNISSNFDFDYGPLNANTLYIHDGLIFIGTDHGVFLKGYPANAIEWQPSSLSHFVYDFWSESSSTPLYACGKDGVLLKTLDSGGIPVPFIEVVAEGACEGGDDITMEGTYGSASSCEWYLDGDLVSSSCSNYTTSLPTSGMYEIKLIGINSTSSDTSIAFFNVVDIPMIDFTAVLSDYLLCKEETVNILLDSSENDVYYSFHDLESTTNYGDSPVGDGGVIDFTTDLINKGGDYIIRANSSIADCSIDFTDTIQIGVEHTKANYHVGVTNIIAGESVPFYENCTEADNYEWTFPSGSSIASSSLPDLNTSFTAPGNQTIQLICWTDNNCYDSIIGPGPTLYNEPAVYDSCWVNQSDGDDLPWTGAYKPGIYDLKEVTGGYIASGTFNEHSFATKYGDSLQFSGTGSHMTKYDNNGVYKWSVHSNGGTALERFAFRSIAEDSQGNIIACGYFNNYYIDNAGDTIYVPTSYAQIGQIIKMDSLGRNIWTRSASRLYPEHITVDNSDNIIFSSKRYKTSVEYDINFYHNDSIAGVLNTPLNVNFSLTKLNSDGDLLWDIPIYNHHTNHVLQRCPQVDDSNNVYLASTMEHEVIMYDTGHPLGFSLSDIGGSLNGYLAKFDSDGNYLWHAVSHGTGAFSPNTDFVDFYTDGNGDSYLSGYNDIYVLGSDLGHRIYSSDGTYLEHEAGRYFVTKINTEGIAQWINGTYTSYQGTGYEIDVKNDTVYVLGQSRANGGVLFDTIQFNSTDGVFIDLPITRYSYFVAAYDTAGALLYVSKNSDDTEHFTHSGWYGFFKGEGDSFFAARSGKVFSGLNDFGSEITNTNGIETWVSKFKISCGITLLPLVVTTIDTVLCIGSDYTFSDGDFVSNITVDIQDTVSYVALNGQDSLIITNISINGYNDLVETVNICGIDESYTYPDGVTVDSITTVTTHISTLATALGCDSIITTVLIPSSPSYFADTVYSCPNEYYIFPDLTEIYWFEETYTHISDLTSDGACDSVISTTLIPLPQYLITDSLSVCYGQDLTLHDGTVLTDIIAPITNFSFLFTEAGCDSVIITVVSPSSLVSFSEIDSICSGGDYTFLDGTTISDITTITVHDNSFVDASGCDSIISTTVIPLPEYAITDSVIVCYGADYIYPDGTAELGMTTASTHLSTLYTESGCDSTIITIVSLSGTTTTLTMTDSVCEGEDYVFPDGIMVSNITSIINHDSYLVNASGCDSTVSTTVIPLPTYEIIDSLIICYGDDYTYPDGTIEFDVTAATSHLNLFITESGCDSTIFTVISLPSMTLITMSDSVCSGEDYLFPDGTIISNITAVTIHESYFEIIDDCDSIIQTTVYPINIDNGITQTGITLTANYPPGTTVTYQWVDCDDSNELILGETNQGFTALEGGNYAVLISVNECTVISPCVTIGGVGIAEKVGNGFSVYPNPTNGTVKVQFGLSTIYSEIQIFNPIGQLISVIPVNETTEEFLLNDSDGVYILKFISMEEGVTNVKVVKQ